MHKRDVELWTIRVVDRLLAGHPVEDSRVELKSTWIPPDKAARRLAGHANAARGENILWLLGVDERARAVSGAGDGDLGTWWTQVAAQFMTRSHRSFMT